MNPKSTSSYPYHLLISFAFLVFNLLTPVAASTELREFAITGGYESWKLPQENMGMARIALQKDFGRGFHGGIESFSAVAGQRGGFITLGVSGSYDYWMTPRLALETGIFLGGGGGRGGYELSGGGLMLREYVGLRYRILNDLQLSAGISHVHFPEGGQIKSHQIYTGFLIPFEALTQPSRLSSHSTYINREEFNLSPHYSHEFSIKIRQLDIGKNVKTDSGQIQSDFGTLGMEWRTYLDSYRYVLLDSAGAYQGNSRGYMHILAGMGYRQPLSSNSSIYGSISTGGGGGGGVDTGGGWLADTTLGLKYHWGRRWHLDTAVSRFWALDSSFRSHSVNLQLGYTFGPRLNQIQHYESNLFDSHPIRIRITQQRYQKGSENWRTRPNQDVDNIGAQLDYFIDPNWYMTGQGLGAYAGDAGAYMVGLIGSGTRQDLSSKVFIELEALVGAAGGGGLNTGSGTVVQSNLNLGYKISKPLEVLGGIGYMKSLNGDFRAHVIGLSLAYKFNVLSAR